MNWWFFPMVLAGIIMLIYRDPIERWGIRHDLVRGRQLGVLAAALAMIGLGLVGLLGQFDPL